MQIPRSVEEKTATTVTGCMISVKNLLRQSFLWQLNKATLLSHQFTSLLCKCSIQIFNGLVHGMVMSVCWSVSTWLLICASERLRCFVLFAFKLRNKKLITATKWALDRFIRRATVWEEMALWSYKMRASFICFCFFFLLFDLEDSFDDGRKGGLGSATTWSRSDERLNQWEKAC